MAKIKEIWKDIPNYEGMYQISNLGRVKSLSREVFHGNGKRFCDETIMKPKLETTGYFSICLRKDRASKTIKIHRLIAMLFIDNPQNKATVNHINGIKTDNRIENLEWCTIQENIQHAISTGLKRTAKGEKHGQSKLLDSDIEYIKNNYIKHKNSKQLSQMFGITYGYVSMIAKGITRNKENYKNLG
jgi:hypothetical protein